MKIITPLILYVALIASLGATESKSRVVTVGDWNITVPSSAENKVTNGPDFSVTYFVFSDLKADLGIYEGGFPQKFSKGAKDLKEEKDKISGQDVTWTLWNERTDSSTLCRGELFLSYEVHQIISPDTKADYANKLHIFISAPDENTLSVIKDTVRTLKRTEAGKPASPKP